MSWRIGGPACRRCNTVARFRRQARPCATRDRRAGSSTAFVRRCVQLLRDTNAFPGGDLHVEFRSADGVRTCLSPDALASCLGALGVAKDVLPPTSAGRANQLRSITASRPVLIVLEDVTDPAQVLPCVPNGPDSAVLVAPN
jgi:hypothetical protein